MKKYLASALAVSMVAGMAVSASAANVEQLQLASNLFKDSDMKAAYAVDYSTVTNRSTYKLPERWGNDGYESDKLSPVLVYGDTKEYNILVYNLKDTIDVHVNDGLIRASKRQYEPKPADHTGSVYQKTVDMTNGYSDVSAFGVAVSIPRGQTLPQQWAATTVANTSDTPFDLRTQTTWYTFKNSDTNGTDKAATSNGSELLGTDITNGVIPSSMPSTLPTDANILANFNVSGADYDAGLTWVPVAGGSTLASYGVDAAYEVELQYNGGGTNVDQATIRFKAPSTQNATPEIGVTSNATSAKAYLTAQKEKDGKYYLVASKDYTFYTTDKSSVFQNKVAKGCYVNSDGIPVAPGDKVEAPQFGFSDNLNDTTLGSGSTIDPDTKAYVITIKSNHSVRDTKIKDFTIEVDVHDGNTFFVEGSSGYSNIRPIVDADRLTNQEDDDKGCVYDFNEKLYDTARVRCTDYVDLYFNGNYDTSRENLRVSTDEIPEIKSYFDDYDVDYINFIARPKFATPVTVIIDADKNSYIYKYDVNTGDVTLMNDDKATYDSTDGWKFKDNTLGIYLVFEEEYENANVKADKSAPVEEPEEPEVTSASEAPSTSTEKPNPGTGANDMVGAAAALAVVSLVAAGAVAVKKLSK